MPNRPPGSNGGAANADASCGPLPSANGQHAPQFSQETPGPVHVGIIMDGNGRWAQRHGLPRVLGHRYGVERLRSVLNALGANGVEYVTLYAFSTENWKRPAEEVKSILALLEEAIYREVADLHARGVRIRHLGRTDRVPEGLRTAITRVQELTQDNKGLTLCVAFDYGGRAEIVEAVRAMIAAGIGATDVSESTISSYLYSAGVPDPDLIIRTGGEQRLSNFLLWQAAYAEYYYTDTLWPDFDEAEVTKALDAYRNRQRRYGAVAAQR